MKWLECDSCDAEFRVISEHAANIEFCPFCGDSIDSVDDYDDYEDE